MNTLTLCKTALRALIRDWRAGELRLLWMSVALGVGVLCAVTFLSNRLQATFMRDAAQWLGGDVVFTLDHAPAPTLLDTAQRMGLKASTTVSLPTMGRAFPRQVSSDLGQSRLVALKAVSSAHPLKGRLKVLPLQNEVSHPATPAQPVSTSEVPKPGTVWMEPAALEALGLSLATNWVWASCACALKGCSWPNPIRVWDL